MTSESRKAPAATPATDLTTFLVQTKAGETIFAAGEAATDLFVIKEGTVALLATKDGHEFELERLGKGDYIGETAILAGARRTISAKALTACSLVKINVGTLESLVRESPRIALGLLRRSAHRLHRLERRVAEGLAAAKPGPSTSGGASLRHAESNERFALGTVAELTVGRIDRRANYTPEINLTSLDEGRTIGRRHARILYRDGEYFIREDTATRNGTFVNGQRLSPNTEIQLAAGDTVIFGVVRLIFELG